MSQILMKFEPDVPFGWLLVLIKGVFQILQIFKCVSF